MTKNAQRLSQVVSTFGPGAMIDLPTRSVVVGGLEQWDMEAELVHDDSRAAPDRCGLSNFSRSRDGSIRHDKSFVAHAADRSDGRPGAAADGDRCSDLPDVVRLRAGRDQRRSAAKTRRRRRLVRWQDLDTRGGRRRFAFDDGEKCDVTPIRFVCACEKGHLQDIDWRWVVHDGQPCQEPMWVEEKGTSADPADTTIVCGCGKPPVASGDVPAGPARQMPRRAAVAARPGPEGCGEKLKLLTRTATNTYFPQVYTVISLPTEEDELTRAGR